MNDDQQSDPLAMVRHAYESMRTADLDGLLAMIADDE